MCRLAAYLGADISLQRFLIAPPHSLMVQGWSPRELRYASLNADGYGFAWFGIHRQPTVYVNPAPIWTDPNLPLLARELHSDLWIASVRSATEGNPVNHANTQPFIDERFIFDHNGLIEGFHQTVRPRLCAMLDGETLAGIKGNTESEYLFALFRHIMNSQPDLPVNNGIRLLIEKLRACLDGQKALINLLISDGEGVYALRHAVNDPSPTLYCTTGDDSFPGAQVVASERLTESDAWREVPEHHILVMKRQCEPLLQAL